MKAARAARGSALPETAIVLTAMLGMVFGIIQIGVIGFLQIMVDGAAFVAAHEYALNDTTNYLSAVAQPFPLAAAPKISLNSPDAENVPVDYNTNLATSRRGGVSLVRSSHLMATVQNAAPSGLLGVGIAALSNAKVHGSAIEPSSLVSNDVYDVAGAGYSSNTASQVSFFNDVQNAPANYVSMQQMVFCNSASFGPNCSNAAIRALGSAEFLDHDNWNRTTLGVGPYGSGYTFAEMLCHQQKYAQAAAIFLPAASNATLPSGLSTTANPSTNVIAQIYSWDYITQQGGGYPPGTETSFGLYPLHPANDC